MEVTGRGAGYLVSFVVPLERKHTLKRSAGRGLARQPGVCIRSVRWRVQRPNPEKLPLCERENLSPRGVELRVGREDLALLAASGTKI